MSAGANTMNFRLIWSSCMHKFIFLLVLRFLWWHPDWMGAKNWRHGNKKQGCQIFRGTIYQNGENIPNDHKINLSAIKYTKWPENWPNGHRIYQHLLLQDTPKFIQIGILGFKMYHLATLFYKTHNCHSEPVQKNNFKNYERLSILIRYIHMKTECTKRPRPQEQKIWVWVPRGCNDFFVAKTFPNQPSHEYIVMMRRWKSCNAVLKGDLISIIRFMCSIDK
jgi:hypothetical protein